MVLVGCRCGGDDRLSRASGNRTEQGAPTGAVDGQRGGSEGKREGNWERSVNQELRKDGCGRVEVLLLLEFTA